VTRRSVGLSWTQPQGITLRWHGVLSSRAARDRRRGGASAYSPQGEPLYEAQIQRTGAGRYVLRTRGPELRGTRYRRLQTLDAAQTAGESWARRRFYVEP
jgi:hypothetical protein